jgi:hypothetical protein
MTVRLQRLTRSTSAPFRVRARRPVSGQLSGNDRREKQSRRPGLPVAFQPPALASWTVLFPPGTSTSLTVGLPATPPRPDPDGVPTFRWSETRPGGRPLHPEGGGVHAAGHVPPAAACRFAAASPCTPAMQPIYPELTLTRRRQGFTHVRPSGLLLTCDSRMGREPLGLNPELRTPPLPATHVRAETGLEH